MSTELYISSIYSMQWLLFYSFDHGEKSVSNFKLSSILFVESFFSLFMANQLLVQLLLNHILLPSALGCEQDEGKPQIPTVLLRG